MRKPIAPRPDDGPPQDQLAEQVVLGCCLIDPEAVGRVLAACRESDFVPEVHRAIFRAIRAIYMREEAVDVITVAAELRRMRLLDRTGGSAYLSALISEVPTSAHAPLYAQRVAELGALRELGEAAVATWRQTRDPQARFTEALAQAQERLDRVGERLAAGAVATPAAELAERVTRTQWLWRGWLPRGYLSALVGDKGRGKSSLALWLAAAVTAQVPWPTGEWLEQAEDVLWLDTEGRQGLLLERLLAWGLDGRRVYLPGADGMAVPRLDTQEGIAEIVRLVRRLRPGLVVVDSLSGGHGADENSSAIRLFLKALAEDVARAHGCGVLAVHHFGKPQAAPGSPRKRREATMADARGSNAFEQLVVSGMVLDRPDDESEVQRLRVDVSNLCVPPEPIGFTLDDHGVPLFVEAPQPERALTLTEKARTFLREYLASGGKPAVAVEQAAYQHGHGLTRRALRNALVPARDWPGVAVWTERGMEYWGLREPQAEAYG